MDITSRTTGLAAEIGGTLHSALNVNIKPVDPGNNGSFEAGMSSGVIAAGLAANSELFQFRWTDATRLAIINTITISAAVSTTFFAAGVPMQISLFKATGWSANGSGGTTLTPAAILKKKTTMANSLLGFAQIINTTALVAGTKTIEANPITTIVAGCPITGSLQPQILAPTNLLEVQAGEYPLVLAAKEGFVLTLPAVPGTGTWQLTVTVDWTEASTY